MLGDAKAHFDGDAFVLAAAASGDAGPARAVVDCLRGRKDSVAAEDSDSASSPVLLSGVPARLDFWDHFDDRPTIKLFAGQQTSGGILRRCFDAMCRCDLGADGPSDWKECAQVGLPSGIDPDTRWTAQDVGFSLNEQGMKEMRTYPLVEYFAHIGVQAYGWSAAGRNAYRYHSWGSPLPYAVAMAAAAGALRVDGMRRFTFGLEPSGSNKTFNMAREARL